MNGDIYHPWIRQIQNQVYVAIDKDYIFHEKYINIQHCRELSARPADIKGKCAQNSLDTQVSARLQDADF